MENKEKDYVYAIGIDEGKGPDECSLIMVKHTKDVKEIVLQKYGDEARLWLDFFYKLDDGNAKVVIEKK